MLPDEPHPRCLRETTLQQRPRINTRQAPGPLPKPLSNPSPQSRHSGHQHIMVVLVARITRHHPAQSPPILPRPSQLGPHPTVRHPQHHHRSRPLQHPPRVHPPFDRSLQITHRPMPPFRQPSTKRFLVLGRLRTCHPTGIETQLERLLDQCRLHTKSTAAAGPPGNGESPAPPPRANSSAPSSPIHQPADRTAPEPPASAR